MAVTARKALSTQGWGSIPCDTSTVCSSNAWIKRCRDGLIAENPARAFHYPKPKKVSANVLTASEVEDYLDAADRLATSPCSCWR